MGHESGNEQVTFRGRMDSRGRVQIRKEERIALGIDDIADGEKILLELDVRVLKRLPGESADD